jgi:hypothetical protein
LDPAYRLAKDKLNPQAAVFQEKVIHRMFTAPLFSCLVRFSLAVNGSYSTTRYL